MMSAERPITHAIDRMPPVRGRVRADEPLARFTWFRVGGPAEVLFEPADADDLGAFLSARPDDLPVSVLGGTSNVLVRDGGVPGVVIRFGKPFADIGVDGVVVKAGAAAADVNVARRAAEAGIAGLEFMVGIPGVVGGALRMNAGAYGTEVKDVLLTCEGVDGRGMPVRYDVAEMGFGYRSSAIADDVIFTAATFRGEAGDPGTIQARMSDIQTAREASQPVRTRTGGSTFANPRGLRAWELIDDAGCRGLKIGGAVVSEHHCNFLINTGDATANDLESLGEEVRRRVKENSGVTLEWEIKRVGVPSAPAVQEAGE